MGAGAGREEMALERLKVVETYFMAGRGTAGKRFLTHHCHPAAKGCEHSGEAEPPEPAASPAIARTVASHDPAVSFYVRSEPADIAHQETGAMVGRGGVTGHKNRENRPADYIGKLRIKPGWPEGDCISEPSLRAPRGRRCRRSTGRTPTASRDGSPNAAACYAPLELTRDWRKRPSTATRTNHGAAPEKTASFPVVQGRRGFSTIASAMCQEAGVATSFCQASIRTSASPATIFR